MDVWLRIEVDDGAWSTTTGTFASLHGNKFKTEPVIALWNRIEAVIGPLSALQLGESGKVIQHTDQMLEPFAVPPVVASPANQAVGPWMLGFSAVARAWRLKPLSAVPTARGVPAPSDSVDRALQLLAAGGGMTTTRPLAAVAESGLSVQGWILLLGPGIAPSRQAAIFSFGEMMLLAGCDGSLGLSKGGSSSVPLCGGEAMLPVHAWVHITITFNVMQQTLSLYRDGQLVCLEDVQQLALKASATFSVGAAAGGAVGGMDGLLDEVRVWAIPLSAAQVLSSWRATTDAVHADPRLFGCWDFNVRKSEHSPLVPDSCANENHGTLLNDVAKPIRDYSTIGHIPSRSRFIPVYLQ